MEYWSRYNPIMRLLLQHWYLANQSDGHEVCRHLQDWESSCLNSDWGCSQNTCGRLNTNNLICNLWTQHIRGTNDLRAELDLLPRHSLDNDWASPRTEVMWPVQGMKLCNVLTLLDQSSGPSSPEHSLCGWCSFRSLDRLVRSILYTV